MAVACGGEGDVGGDPQPLELRQGGGGVCEPIEIDPRRALFETHVDVLEPFTLEAVLHHAAKNAGYKADASELYQRIIDTYATDAQGRFDDGQHCDDDEMDPSLTNPGELGCGLLGCDTQFFCDAHGSQCFQCNTEGQCQPATGVTEVCSFDGALELCSFDGRHVGACVPAEAGECDDAGCSPLGCDAVQLCDTTFDMCFVCNAELEQCELDFGVPDEPVERVCTQADGCDIDVATGAVLGCEPDPECEEAQCGPLGCEAQFFCTPEFEACFQCSGDGQTCQLDGQTVPSPTQVCNFDNELVCTFVDGVIESCMEDIEGVCFGFGGGGGGETDGGDDTNATIGFIFPGESGGSEVGDPSVGEVSFGSDPSFASTDVVGEGGSFEETGGSEVDGGSFDGTATFGDTEFGDTTFGDDGGDGDGGGGFGALDGNPLECPRIERAQIDNLDQWFPIAISNRFDLAPADGANCGEQRIVFANNAQNRMFIILEAQVPNPDPSCGLDACRPVAEFWAELNDETDLLKRRRQLKKAFLTGHPKLEQAGFGPFVNAEHYAFGTGQVRTNNFDDSPWTLREFKMVEHPRVGKKSLVRVAQVPVSASPVGDYFNDSIDTPRGEACRASFIEAMEHLLTDEPDAMSFPVDPQCLGAESRDDEISDYALQMVLGTGAFEAAIETRLAELGSSLTAIDIANRARFAGACIGCHQQSNGANLGNGVIAPQSAGFTHTVEFSRDCPEGDGQCFGISQALEQSMLPHREQVLEQYLAATPCGAVCSGEYAVEASGPIDVRRALAPSGTVDVNRMRALELRRRERGAQRTIGGQSTRATH